MAGRHIKTEHAGAKNGGGFYGPRAEAKATSRKLRRGQIVVAIREYEHEIEVDGWEGLDDDDQCDCPVCMSLKSTTPWSRVS